MHAEAITDSLILHTTLLKLTSADNQLCIMNHKASTSIAEQIWFVKNVILFVPENTLKFETGRMKCKFPFTTGGPTADLAEIVGASELTKQHINELSPA